MQTGSPSKPRGKLSLVSGVANKIGDSCLLREFLGEELSEKGEREEFLQGSHAPPKKF